MTMLDDQTRTRSRPVDLALVGLGFGAKLLDGELAGQDDCRVVRLCDRDGERLRAAVERTGLPGCGELDEVLADPAIEAIGLFTEPASRPALLRRCIDAGKHVLTTKPFALDPEAARAVLAHARAAGVVVHVNSPSPAPPDLARIAAWREERDLGRPLAAHAVTYHRYDERADGSWFDDPARCPAAPLYRLGIYLINDLVRLLGPAAAVHVQCSRIATGRPTPDHAQMAIRFRSGALATVQASLCIGDGLSYRNALALHCERGSIFRNVGPRRSERTLLELATADGTERRELDGYSGLYQWDLFRRAVRGEPVDAAEAEAAAVDGAAVVQAMAASERDGREVAL